MSDQIDTTMSVTTAEAESVAWCLHCLFDDIDDWDDAAEPRTMTQRELKETIKMLFDDSLDDADEAAWNEAARPLIEAGKTAGFYRDTASFLRHSIGR